MSVELYNEEVLAKRKEPAVSESKSDSASASKRRAVDSYAVVVPPPAAPLPSDLDFKITLDDNIQHFREMLDTVSKLLDDCTFIVSQGAGFTGISINAQESSKCCMIVSKLACNVQSRGEQMFCVGIKGFKKIIGILDLRLRVEISRQTGASEIVIHSFNQVDGSQSTKITWHTIDAEPEEYALDKLIMDVQVSLDLAKFRNDITAAQVLDASDIRIRVLKPKESSGSQEHFYVIMGTSNINDAYENVYHSMGQIEEMNGNKTVVIRTVDAVESNIVGMRGQVIPSMDTLHVMVDQKYSVYYLNLFLSSLKNIHVTMYMSAHMPLVLKYALGQEPSHMSFVLGAKADEK